MDTMPETKAPLADVLPRDLRAAALRFFSDPKARENPAVFFDRLVREAPVLELGPMWLVSGFDELTWLSSQKEVRSFPSVRGRTLPMTPVPSLASLFALMFPMRDGADHRRLKGLASAAFSPARIAQIRGLIEESVDDLMSRAMARGEMDVVTDLSLPLPVAVSSAMLDVPVAYRAKVHDWAMIVRRQLLRYDQSPEEIAYVEAEMRAFTSFVRSLCDARRRSPGGDLISDLAAAETAGVISADEVLAFVLMLFVNGLETLTAGLTMAVWEMLEHPEEHAAVAADEAHAEAVFDETIRLHSPVRFSARTLVADVMLGGHRLREGDVVTLCYGAANRDPRRFDEPERWNPQRGKIRHLGFGHGAHFCLGAQLSLTTGAAVLQRMAKIASRLTTSVTRETMAWSPALAFTTLTSLPLRVAQPGSGA